MQDPAMKGDIDDLICAECGKPAKGNIYRTVEVTGQGWSDVDLKIEDDDSISATVDPTVQEIEYDGFFRTELNWACAECGVERAKIEDLVDFKPGSHILDPIRWLQKHPLPGQETLPV
jgi:hypothetical protein